MLGLCTRQLSTYFKLLELFNVSCGIFLQCTRELLRGMRRRDIFLSRFKHLQHLSGRQVLRFNGEQRRRELRNRHLLGRRRELMRELRGGDLRGRRGIDGLFELWHRGLCELFGLCGLFELRRGQLPTEHGVGDVRELRCWLNHGDSRRGAVL
jgi:hypothetical protein